ncbi:hypothetical protein A3H10_02810 [Candidatus Uhrbacteria bacterium RIFCSPLOWO2_12_FULL_46_10]|uniref:Galactose-1-phosphate uridyl transferase N-terminal domain-containing protein n=1 Tax=Candidatus Uhrbacteria bacterium RIFCSPLOWO2_01_FULL_47_25 TaxID=1802402 RepID=A0A1F7UUL6_9BACT|nr:MAG: Galactose-1-phosphate uridylyltransferase [Parcubacteria group bacterium GW2011_GWA2_46_9]OGL60837.1 MAG: hypothetical protein A2752_00290 [Candidatus Uhrbacteria bacterium RIFCSPHIGHO2_01_FULL_46_23]OGL68223.1 MAG: hypothetical protein A3D60_00325 [Candidatus Uhrbacteria bacterium RIFCSPHIGHO2_02_FULL_47_29]OGL75393.1 MAG: hypothetical protein A3E96_04575 [Candidatus Uhrbacteria bacterium RIFCSPHIGHO2_12_FULL_46_13]OGL81983.1 MAG: hypothetical protein A2936_05450 [Candidatus Uhrbacteri
MKSELRKDYILDKYVIIAPRRGSRPETHDINYESSPGHLTVEPKDCGLCFPHLDLKKKLFIWGGRKNWRMITLPNKYPAVTLDNPKAYGWQEVVVETQNHNLQLEELPQNHITKLLEVYAIRTKSIMANSKIEYILIFKNNGGKAGATIQHSHSQIFATGFVPQHYMDKSQRVQAYKLKTGHCIYCDVIAKERRGPRLVYEDKKVVAFTPYASVYNYELWLMPKRHVDNITDLTLAERQSLARMMKQSINKIVHNLQLAYNYYFHQIVHDTDEHLYIKITPRGSTWAGVEIASGIIINPVPPEKAAIFYRR